MSDRAEGRPTWDGHLYWCRHLDSPANPCTCGGRPEGGDVDAKSGDEEVRGAESGAEEVVGVWEADGGWWLPAGFGSGRPAPVPDWWVYLATTRYQSEPTMRLVRALRDGRGRGVNVGVIEGSTEVDGSAG